MTDAIQPEPIADAEIEEARRYSMVIVWSDEDRVYLVTVPELPGLVTHGATVADAVDMGEEAIATWIAGSRRFGASVPPPSDTPRRFVLERLVGYNGAAVRAIRERFSLRPEMLGELLGVPEETVAAWERDDLAPDPAAARLLCILTRHPEALFRPLPVPA